MGRPTVDLSPSGTLRLALRLNACLNFSSENGERCHLDKWEDRPVRFLPVALMTEDQAIEIGFRQVEFNRFRGHDAVYLVAVDKLFDVCPELALLLAHAEEPDLRASAEQARRLQVPKIGEELGILMESLNRLADSLVDTEGLGSSDTRTPPLPLEFPSSSLSPAQALGELDKIGHAVRCQLRILGVESWRSLTTRSHTELVRSLRDAAGAYPREARELIEAFADQYNGLRKKIESLQEQNAGAKTVRFRRA
jgi:hypothetical protein